MLTAVKAMGAEAGATRLIVKLPTVTLLGPVLVRVTSKALPFEPAAAVTDWTVMIRLARALVARARASSPASATLRVICHPPFVGTAIGGRPGHGTRNALSWGISSTPGKARTP